MVQREGDKQRNRQKEVGDREERIARGIYGTGRQTERRGKEF